MVEPDDLFAFYRKNLIFRERVLTSWYKKGILNFCFALSLMFSIIGLIPPVYFFFTDKPMREWGYVTLVSLFIGCCVLLIEWFLNKKFILASMLKNKKLRKAIYDEKNKRWDMQKFRSLAQVELYNYLIKNNLKFSEIDTLEKQLLERAKLAFEPVYLYWAMVGSMIFISISACIEGLALNGIPTIIKYIFLIVCTAWIVKIFTTIIHGCIFTKHAKYNALIDMLRTIRTDDLLSKK